MFASTILFAKLRARSVKHKLIVKACGHPIQVSIIRYMSLFDGIFSLADNKIYLEAVKVFEVIFQFHFTTLILTVLWFYNPPSLHLKHN